jgi:hypothetical protein|tara:strand:- start:774 stop:1448 length:675 start_codon:yes stop_codon:yes gene_type:complete
MLKIRNRTNIKNSIISGMDCPELCLDKEHFRNYPKKISYKYNTNGFRDHEWPTDLSDVIWCVGDSFTVGIGQPFEETWPNLLQKKLNKRCLNLGEDGCSNDTMALRIKEICKLHNPKLIVVMWSYLARRRRNNKDIDHDKNDFGDDMDLVNFSKNFKIANESSTNILNLLIPFAFDGIDSLKEKYKDLIIIPQLDYARDRHHFDIMTSYYVTELIKRKIQTIDF